MATPAMPVREQWPTIEKVMRRSSDQDRTGGARYIGRTRGFPVRASSAGPEDQEVTARREDALDNMPVFILNLVEKRLCVGDIGLAVSLRLKNFGRNRRAISDPRS